ncbi:phosphatidate cytidylyltransferase [Uliginosibacterium sp. H3]|uniref:Phosphatidate cytidylyltransferase n=1 Tax=Uliginosibacterium silvisoli TaxID=3114758 RepID=A0ABU6K119_9RHOO|nr:phosphatidate cytidylyltransferase [Uliginosibacterium sp. H3]
MNPQEALVSVFAGVTGLLLMASAVGAVLKARLAPGTVDTTIINLNTRIKAWWVMIGALALAFWIGPLGIAALFAFISLQCLREFISLTTTRQGDQRALAWSFFFFLPLQYFLIATNRYGLFSILIPVYAFLLLPIAAVTSADVTRYLDRAARMQWGLMICVYCISYVPALMTLDIPGYSGRNALLVAFLVLTVQSSDVFQYIWGRLFGKRKIAPHISPSKTVEGLVGGVLTSTALGTAVWWITPFTFWQAALVALTINIMGFYGGLVLSAIKRDKGVKDWGKMIGGHGGMLDRVDSISFSAPVFFHIVRYWWVP